MKKYEQVKMDSTKSFSEMVLELAVSAGEVASLAKGSEIDSEALGELSIYIENLSPILDTLREDKLIMDTPNMRSAIGSLEAELQRARNLIVNRSMCSVDDHLSDIVQQVNHDLGRSLGLLLSASIEVSLHLKGKLGGLHKEMMNAKYYHCSCSSSESGTGEIVEEMSSKRVIGDIVEVMSSKSITGEIVQETTSEGVTGEIVKETSSKTVTEVIVEEMSSESVTREIVEEMSCESVTREIVEEMSCKSVTREIVEEVSSESITTEIVEEMYSERITTEIVEEKIINDDDDNDDNNNDDKLCSDKEEFMIIRMEREDVALQLKYGNDEEFKNSLLGLEVLVRDKIIDSEWITDEGIIHILINRLKSNKCIDRFSIIKVLRSIALENKDTKEKMTDLYSLTTLVKSLARDEMERREAVGLLMDLSKLPSVRRRIGKIQGCIIMLVAIFNGNDPISSNDAGNLLGVLSSNTQNAILMAEAGYFHALIQHLKEGSEMSKILMATSLSRMILTENTRASLGKDDAIKPLVTMFKTGKLEAKLSALDAIQKISLSSKNIPHVLSSGILAPLLQLLFSVTSSLMSLQEPASSILATVSSSDAIIEYKDLPNQLLSLLNLSSPKIKCNILVALNNILSQPGATQLRNRIVENGAMQLLIPFIYETNTKIRTAALNLLCIISNTMPIEESCLPQIVSLISSSSSDAEKAAATGLLHNIPLSDKKTTEKLRKANLLPMLVSLMDTLNASSSSNTTKWLEENVAGVFIRFTLPSDKKLQLYAAQIGVIPILAKFLSDGSIKAKSRAAVSLTQLSQNSLSLRRIRTSRWKYCVPSRTSDHEPCEIHCGHCSVERNFCMVKAGVIPPLIRILKGDERDADEEVLIAISTLLQDEIWEDGSNFIAKISGGMEAIIRVLEVGSVQAKEKALWILERVLRIDSHRMRYGALTQVMLIDLAQKGDPPLRSLVAKLLAQLELLQEQSSYFLT